MLRIQHSPLHVLHEKCALHDNDHLRSKQRLGAVAAVTAATGTGDQMSLENCEDLPRYDVILTQEERIELEHGVAKQQGLVQVKARPS